MGTLFAVALMSISIALFADETAKVPGAEGSQVVTSSGTPVKAAGGEVTSRK